MMKKISKIYRCQRCKKTITNNVNIVSTVGSSTGSKIYCGCCYKRKYGEQSIELGAPNDQKIR